MTPEQLHKYDSIRPFAPEELPEVFDRLVQNEQFCQVLAYLYPGVPVEAIRQKMHQCKTNLEFQKAFCYEFLKNLLAKASLGCDADFSNLDLRNRYTFISNHRDIVLDSALLHVMLFDAGCDTTTEIAIGDNLLKLPWVKDIVRLNKSFIVQRSLPMRQMLAASKLLAEYMHFVIAEKNDNVWIAQREGRAKDSNDRTAEAILKMMTMGGEGSIKERLLSLHLVPLAISYEYDPCDFLKAQEFQLRRDVADWKKGPMDDVVSMQTGIMGYKGHIHYHAAPCIDEWLRALPDDMSKTEFYTAVAQHLDHEIWRGYRLYPSNFVALDLLRGTAEHADRYTAEDRQCFEAYLDAQLKKVQLPNPDWAFLRERILTMYANPAINQLSVI
ncbi:1-acyl-sn-glycerol-3-phosphate acyltransferase [Leyella stercorea]|uniref:1-acyl-sn-glycerol-3-phosphate acyltransferase n=1 Tax=Leyella stercorea TaxID=363265 RepID=UPI00248B1FE7|nr:1-acyl-sn-glycerol-3-phosphate acyltransferase [Leyella stercorea]